MIESIHYEIIKEHSPRHGLAVCLGDQIPTAYCGKATAEEVFLSLGHSEFLDVDYNGKARLNHDLNEPLPVRSATFLFDGGVIEHVANIGTALVSIAQAMRTGGVVFHSNPICAYGESYYGVDPMLFRDFYLANGFELLEYGAYTRRSVGAAGMRWASEWLPKPVLEWAKGRLKKTTVVKGAILADDLRSIKVHRLTDGWRRLPYHANGLVAVRKIREVERITWPAQSQYPR